MMKDDDVAIVVLNGQYTQFRITDAMGETHTMTLDLSHMTQLIRALADRMASMHMAKPI